MQTYKILTADAVIVGGGAAGTNAALNLKKLGFDPLLVSKGLVGKSGASIFAGNLHVAGLMLGNTESDVHDAFDFQVRWFNHFLIDQHYVRSIGSWIPDVFYPELEEKGFYIRRDDQGSIVTSIGRVRTMGAPRQGRSGAMLMDVRRKQLVKQNVRMLEEAAVTTVLCGSDGKATGVVVLHIPTGEIYVVHAEAVVLACGYADRIALRSTGTREQSADGLALAFRAGAELMNLEIQWWHTSDFAYPVSWQRMHVYPNPLVGTPETARMYNSDGEMFFEQKSEVPISFAPYVTQQKRLIQQVMKGKARFDGGFYTSYDHIDPTVIKNFNDHNSAFEKLGLNPGSDKVETAVSWHFRQGGVNVNPYTMETRVSGLYVAGALGGHSNGSITVASYDGALVAKTLSQKLRKQKNETQARTSNVEAEIARLSALLRPMPNNGIPPMHIKNRIRKLMWNKMGPIKNGPQMHEALGELHEIREKLLPKVGLQKTTRSYNYGWMDAIDIHNMLDVCELTVHGCLRREESRGPFYREDFPFTDNDNWLVKNIISRGERGLEFRIEPYETPFLKPEFGKRDYFEVDW